MSTFIETIKLKLQQPLPGFDAQMKMAPPVRNSKQKPPADAKLAGVMILLVESEKTWNTFIIKRTQFDNAHGGQIAFPGGKFEIHDADIVETALRECEEEIGVSRDLIEVLGTLTPLFIPPSNFYVTPTIGYIQRIQAFKPSEKEVSEIIKVPLDLLFHETVKSKQMVKRSDIKTETMETPVYALSDDIIIWGATAMMISELEHLIQNK